MFLSLFSWFEIFTFNTVCECILNHTCHFENFTVHIMDYTPSYIKNDSLFVNINDCKDIISSIS